MIIKRLMEQFGSDDLSFHVRAVAVHADDKTRVVIEKYPNDNEVRHFYLCDETIHSGYTMSAAFTAAPSFFPSADIYANRQKNSFRQRESDRKEAIQARIAILYNEIWDALDEGDLKKARNLYTELVTFAREHKTPLSPGALHLGERLQENT